MCWQRWEQKFPLWSDDRSEISLTSSCSASGFFFCCFVLLLLAQGHWRWVQRTLITFILLYWLIISISPGTIWTDLAPNLPPGTVVLICLFIYFLKYEVCVWCMHKTGIRSDLNTHFLEKKWTPVSPSIIFQKQQTKRKKEVSGHVLFDCWPLRDLSAD